MDKDYKELIIRLMMIAILWIFYALLTNWVSANTILLSVGGILAIIIFVIMFFIWCILSFIFLFIGWE